MRQLKSETGFTLIELLIVTAILGVTMAAVLGIYQVTQRSTFFATAGEDAQVVVRAVLDRVTADLQLLNAGNATSTGAITVATPNATATTFEFLAPVRQVAENLLDVGDTLDSSGNFITVAAYAAVDAPSITVNNASVISCGTTITIADGPISEARELAPGTATNANACKSGTGNNTLALTTKLTTYYPIGSFVRSVETVSYRWDGPPPPAGTGSGKLCRSVGSACPTSGLYSDPQLLAENVTKFQLTFLDSANPPNSTTDLGLIRAVRVEVSVASKSGDQTVSRTMRVTVRPRNFK